MGQVEVAKLWEGRESSRNIILLHRFPLTGFVCSLQSLCCLLLQFCDAIGQVTKAEVVHHQLCCTDDWLMHWLTKHLWLWWLWESKQKYLQEYQWTGWKKKQVWIWHTKRRKKTSNDSPPPLKNPHHQQQTNKKSPYKHTNKQEQQEGQKEEEQQQAPPPPPPPQKKSNNNEPLYFTCR